MTDRELLERAARAAGIVIAAPVERHVAQPGHFAGGFIINNDKGGQQCWNPLTDDGDAFRLAVKLSMNLVVTCKSPSLPLGVTDARSTESGWATESHAMCPYTATRRAVVRAAAAMGES